MTTCSHENLISSPNICLFIAEHCHETFSYYNFLHLYYCNLHESLPLIILISLIFAFLVFNVLGAISDTYLAPALETVSKKLKLSETVSGITLLAFAASAPDVVTGLVAGGKEEGGSRIVVGGLFGACLFTVTIVLAGCIKGAKQVNADPKALVRDIGFLLIAVVYFLVLTLFEEITPVMAAGFWVIYIVFFVYVIWTEKMKMDAKKIKKPQETREIEIGDSIRASEDEDKEEVGNRRLPLAKLEKWRRAKTHSAIGGKSDDDEEEESELGVSVLNISYRKGFRRMDSELPLELRLGRNRSQARKQSMPTKRRVLKRAETDNFTHLLKEIDDDLSETSSDDAEHIGTFHKILKVVNIPILFVGDLTMPPVESERWSPGNTALTAILGPLFLIWQFGYIEDMSSRWYNWTIFGVVSALMAVIIFIKGKKKNLAKEYQGLFSTITLVISVFWLNLVSSITVDFLMFVQIATGLSLYFLSITILAWGNSLEDYFVNYAIAKTGHGRTALGGVYGSQIFALMVGFSGGLFRLALKEPIRLGLYNFAGENLRENIMTLVLLGSNVVVLVLTLLVGKCTKWVMGREVIIFVLVFYAMFTVAMTVISFA